MRASLDPLHQFSFGSAAKVLDMSLVGLWLTVAFAVDVKRTRWKMALGSREANHRAAGIEALDGAETPSPKRSRTPKLTAIVYRHPSRRNPRGLPRPG